MDINFLQGKYAVIDDLTAQKEDLDSEQKFIIFDFLRKGDQYFELYQNKSVLKENIESRNQYLIRIVLVFNQFLEYGFEQFDQENHLWSQIKSIFNPWAAQEVTRVSCQGSTLGSEEDQWHEHYWLYVKKNLSHLRTVKFINAYYSREATQDCAKMSLSWLFLCLYQRQDLVDAFLYIFNDNIFL